MAQIMMAEQIVSGGCVAKNTDTTFTTWADGKTYFWVTVHHVKL